MIRHVEYPLFFIFMNRHLKNDGNEIVNTFDCFKFLRKNILHILKLNIVYVKNSMKFGILKKKLVIFFFSHEKSLEL